MGLFYLFPSSSHEPFAFTSPSNKPRPQEHCEPVPQRHTFPKNSSISRQFPAFCHQNIVAAQNQWTSLCEVHQKKSETDFNLSLVLYSENSSNAFRRLRRRRPAPQNSSGFAAIFDNFKFFYELIITHCSKFFKKNLLIWRQIL